MSGDGDRRPAVLLLLLLLLLLGTTVVLSRSFIAVKRSWRRSPPRPLLLLSLPPELPDKCGEGDRPGTGVVTALDNWKGDGEGKGDGANAGDGGGCGLVATVVTFQRKLVSRSKKENNKRMQVSVISHWCLLTRRVPTRKQCTGPPPTILLFHSM